MREEYNNFYRGDINMKYRKKPVVIEAIQFIDTPERLDELSQLIDNNPLRVDY